MLDLRTHALLPFLFNNYQVVKCTKLAIKIEFFLLASKRKLYNRTFLHYIQGICGTDMNLLNFKTLKKGLYTLPSLFEQVTKCSKLASLYIKINLYS